jgi:hypothetical protein
MRGGGIKILKDLRIPAFLGALLDILPRCIDMKEENGEVSKGYYNQHLTTEIREGAYNHDGHMDTKLIESQRLGPYPSACVQV